MNDSVRGTPGWMVPIPDVTVDQITRAEAQRLAGFYQLLDGEVGRFVPVVAAFQRMTSDDVQTDRIVTEVRLAPYSETRIAKWANMLAPTDNLRVAPIDGDVVSTEIVLDALGQPVHVFGGFRHSRTPLVVRQGEVAPSSVPAQPVRGYVGTWPRPLELLETFLGPQTGPPDNGGSGPQQSVVRSVVTQVGRFLPVLVQARRADGSRAATGDGRARASGPDPGADCRPVRQTNRHGLQRAGLHAGPVHERKRATRFMNSLATELHVPPADAKGLAEQLVRGRFECPLGGDV